MTGQIAQNGFERARRPRLEACALLALLIADGVLTRALGGPAWLTGLYAGLGVVCALARVGLSRRRGAVPATAMRHRPAPEAGGAVRPVPVRRTAIGYMRMRAAGDRATLAAHHSALTAHADAHGLELWAVVHDVDGDPGGRQALQWALDRIAAGDAQVLAVARLEHVAGSADDLSVLLRWLDRDGRALVAVDPALDTSTQAGRLAAAAVLDSAAVPAHPRRGGTPPPANPRAAVADRPELQQRILAMRDQGLSLQAIADRLNAEGVPTARGGVMWRPSSVQCAAGYHRPRRPRRGIEVPRSQPSAPSLGAPR
jgi:Resolvase, N terminal domain/Recombinase